MKMSKYRKALTPSYFPSTAHYLVRLLVNLAGVCLPAEDTHGNSLSPAALWGDEALKNI